MVWRVLFFLLGTFCAVSTHFQVPNPAIFEGFENPLHGKDQSEMNEKIQSLSKRFEQGSSETNDVLSNLKAEVQALKELVSSLTDKSSSVVQTDGAAGGTVQNAEQQEQRVESDMNSVETARKEASELKANLGDLRAEAELTKTKVLEIEEAVKNIGTRMDANKDKLDKSLGEVKGEVSGLNEMIQMQCLNTDHQNAVLLDTVQIPRKLESLVFTSARSSTEPLEAAKAIDGNRNPSFRAKSCTHTDPNDTSPWWQGSLTAESEVHKIILTNRGDCCPERLSYFKVEGFVDDPVTSEDAEAKLCKEVKDLTVAVAFIECEQPITARYIRITKQNKAHLTLCEVDAEGFVLPKQPQGLAIQSSLASPVSGAMMATDKDPVTCSETLSETGRDQWWQVDLTARQTVTAVSITNRKDDKLPSGVCASFDGTVDKGETVTLTCKPDVTGRYMRIKEKKRGALSLCEVEINTVD